MTHHMDTALDNPDYLAMIATGRSTAGLHKSAFNAAAASIRARAGWVNINGKWVPRKGVMRT